VDGGSDDADELERLVSGLKVDAASLRGLEASLFTREGVSVPVAEGGCDMINDFYFRCRGMIGICIVAALQAN
jgi:hypothetical protein